mmetsp:Transcript_12908/g.22329  ORF Transcript_12908/g.22329 Transcript_12908/m.22329 type:complete len:180 (+) Transcript_12908:417-956(+)
MVTECVIQKVFNIQYTEEERRPEGTRRCIASLASTTSRLSTVCLAASAGRTAFIPLWRALPLSAATLRPAATSSIAANAPAATATCAANIELSLLLFFLGQGIICHHINHLIGNAEVFNIVASYVAFWNSPELVSVPRSANNFSQVDVHPTVAVDQSPIVCLSVFELNEHGMALRSSEE